MRREAEATRGVSHENGCRESGRAGMVPDARADRAFGKSVIMLGDDAGPFLHGRNAAAARKNARIQHEHIEAAVRVHAPFRHRRR